MNLRQLLYAALLLALALVFQSLRFFIPIPPVFTTFLIGSLVNACILLAVDRAGLLGAVLIAIITPVMAYIQQLLLLPLFILPVAVGNSLFALFYWMLRRQLIVVRLGIAAGGKCIALYGCFVWLFSLITLPEQAVKTILFVMSWPQFITGMLGGWLAIVVHKRLPKLK